MQRIRERMHADNGNNTTKQANTGAYSKSNLVTYCDNGKRCLQSQNAIKAVRLEMCTYPKRRLIGVWLGGLNYYLLHNRNQ